MGLPIGRILLELLIQKKSVDFLFITFLIHQNLNQSRNYCILVFVFSDIFLYYFNKYALPIMIVRCQILTTLYTDFQLPLHRDPYIHRSLYALFYKEQIACTIKMKNLQVNNFLMMECEVNKLKYYKRNSNNNF